VPSDLANLAPNKQRMRVSPLHWHSINDYRKKDDNRIDIVEVSMDDGSWHSYRFGVLRSDG
jgi:hypothetical protein